MEPDRVEDYRKILEGLGVTDVLDGLRKQVEGLETLDPERPKTWDQRAPKYLADLANWAWVGSQIKGCGDAELAPRVLATAMKVSGTKGSLPGGIVDYALVSLGSLEGINAALPEGCGWVAQEVSYPAAKPPIEVVWSGEVPI